VFSLFVVYTTWAAFQGNHYHYEPYLSPFYSPVVHARDMGPAFNYEAAGMVPPSDAWLGTFPSWWPGFIPMSPALLILMFPGGFRFTCYYYRKAYYRSFAGSPPGCAVGPLAQKKKYFGETRLLIIQNLHRYFLYAALAFIFLLGKDAVESFFKHGKFGVGVGSLIMTVNVCLIAAYTFGCHSFRHLIGGRKDYMCSGGSPNLGHKGWKRATWFNERHQQFAWASLLWVMLTDVYIRLLSTGVIKDLNTW
jgi:hypothetical protein